MTNESDWENTSDNPRARYIVPNLDRALVMLELLSSRPEGINVSDLGVELKIPKNSAFRIAVTLENRGFLEKVENTKRYRLTPRLLILGAMSVTDANLFEKSIDVMRRLRDATGETALLGTLADDEGVVLDQALGTHHFKFAVDPGTRFCLHTAAPGKAMLAGLPEKERIERVKRLKMPRFTANTITSHDAFLEHLKEVGARGYGFDLAEEMEGQTCIGAAIRGATGAVIAALWITAPSSRIQDGQLDAFGAVVKAHADEISSRFGAVLSQIA
ncbi:IclR family transcriptional regulator [Haloferula sp. BvORR071]|uniref:IclR family transcriptional regulator n=1 Tax=Haloferula sp. BvORR071 TaxID=1396141 RepID=UPI0006971034|nr:IclR family transcriptional regulator [Haloferula sp. BvORR071]